MGKAFVIQLLRDQLVFQLFHMFHLLLLLLDVALVADGNLYLLVFFLPQLRQLRQQGAHILVADLRAAHVLMGREAGVDFRQIELR